VHCWEPKLYPAGQLKSTHTPSEMDQRLSGTIGTKLDPSVQLAPAADTSGHAGAPSTRLERRHFESRKSSGLSDGKHYVEICKKINTLQLVKAKHVLGQLLAVRGLDMTVQDFSCAALVPGGQG